MTTSKVGITGMGIVSSIGDDVTAFCNSLRNGKTGIKRVSAKQPKVSVDIGAEIENFSFLDLDDPSMSRPGAWEYFVARQSGDSSRPRGKTGQLQ